MSLVPKTIQWGKHCFVACPPERCDCAASQIGNFGDSSDEQLKRQLQGVPLPNYTEHPQMSDTKRAAFEAWATNPDRGGKLPIEKHLNGAYCDTRTYTAWYGWQAARAQPERAVLSDTEIESLVEWMGDPHDPYFDRIKFARAILAAQPITQPLIAEATRDDADSQMAMVGTCLAHVALNYSQRIGHTLESDDCTLLRKLHDQWVSAIASTPRKTGNPVMATRDDAMTALKKLHVGDSSFEGWFAEKDMRGLGTKQLCRDAYAAGMEDPVIAQLIAAVKRDDVAVDARDAALNQLRDWFSAQRKAISKGCGSAWDMVQCDEQIDLIDAAIFVIDGLKEDVASTQKDPR